MEIQKVMIIGAGQMGSGIAQVCAQAGLDVILYDIREEAIEQGIGALTNNLNRSITKGKLTQEHKEELLERIQTSLTLDLAETADLVIEAATENMAVKSNIFRELDRICPSHSILATNTSSLPITEIAAVTNRPEKVIGMHFMNPVPVMPLVEIIRGLATAEEVLQAIKALSVKLGKTAVEVHDYPGFVSNRILMPMINEAIYTVYEGVATIEDVDQVMKLGMNHPMGPLALADFIGLDTCLSIMEILYEGFSDSKYRPCPLLRKYVKAGRLGRKTGRGFHIYS